jgi:Regulator of ribonuclease activity B
MNRRVLLRSAACFGMCTTTLVSLAQTESRIPLAQLEEMFADMRRKTRWNMDGPLLWGYFFIDSSQDRLAELSNRLTADGYKFVEIRQAGDSSILKQLHVEKVEVHSPATLHARNAQLYALASQFGIASYDGMDVGPTSAAAK